jgi:hypothetical protein
MDRSRVRGALRRDSPRLLAAVSAYHLILSNMTDLL